MKLGLASSGRSLSRQGQRSLRLGGVIAGLPPVTGIALDAPVTTALAPKTSFTFADDRWVEGYSGNTTRLRRLSDNAEQDFGFDALGIFNWSAMNAWRAGADVDRVRWYDQRGSGRTLDVVSGTTVAFIRSNAPVRMGADFNPATSELTRSTVNGAPGANMGGVGALQLPTSGLSLSAGAIEMHLLWSPNNRKRGTLDTADPVSGGTTTRENIICYGNNTNNQFFHHIAGGTTTDLVRVQSGGAQTQPTGMQMTNHRWKARSQWVTSYILTPTVYQEYTAGRLTKNTAHAAATITAIAGGSMNNGAIGIGAHFSSTTTQALGTTNRGDFVFGGLVVTTGLTARERWELQARISQVANQHLRETAETIRSWFDEIVLHKNVNAGTGRVVGEKGQLTVDFNLPGSGFTVGAATANEGLIGLQSVGYNNLANSFQATDSFFAAATSGTVIRFAVAGNDASQNGNLAWDFSMSAGNPQIDTRAEWSFGLGYNHATNCMTTLVNGTYDNPDRIGGRRTSTGLDFGTALYENQAGGGGNQEHAKYNINTVNRSMIYGETFGGYTWTEPTWAQTDPSRPFNLDAPVIRNVPENISYGWKQDHLAFHVGMFEAPTGYSRSDSYAVNQPKFLQGKGWSLVSGGATSPIGHMDGSYAHNPYASVKHSADNHRIQSVPWQGAFVGTRIGWAIKAGEVFSFEKAERCRVNWYKII